MRFEDKLDRVTRRDLLPAALEEKRYSFTQWLGDLSETYTVGGTQYTLPVQFTQTGKRQPPVPNEYIGFVGAFKGCAPIFSVMMQRARLFSEVELKFRSHSSGKLFGSPALLPLEEPWPNGTTGDLLTLAEFASTLGGNSYIQDVGSRFRWLRPDWVSIILASSVAPENPAFASDAEIVGYIYQPYNTAGDTHTEYIPVNEMAHWTPIPDPIAPWRGMSWLSPIITEIMADNAATEHKLSFFEHGATPNLAIKLPESVINKAQFEEIRDAMEASHTGSRNAFKTLYLAAGADVTAVGIDMTKLDFRSIQGAGEVRIANAAGIHASVAGLGESLKGSSLNSGNFAAASRSTGDTFLRPHWRSFCSAHAKLVKAPPGSKLWFDAKDVAFLKEDQTDLANIQQAQSATVQMLINTGYEPDAAVAFVQTNDLTQLVGKHTGLVSVQLQAPGTSDPAPDPAAPSPEPPAADPPAAA